MAILPTGIGPVTGYNIERSLRFNSADSAYLNRTPGSAGNRDTWTLSVWVKRSKGADFRTIFSAATDTSNLTIVRFTDGDKLEVRSATSGSTVFQLVTTQLFRDYSAWYHIVLAVDTTNATGGNRVRLYVNGSEVTVFDTDTNPTQNADSWVNSTALHEIGRQANNASNYYYDGYITECYLIDGSQKTPSDFGETDIDTGVWKPKAYSGTYGTNGFFLKFADNSGTTSTTLGKDSSGNGNNWTPNNFSVTAGAGNDSLVDSPTSYGTDTGVGGTVRGNYCTFNPLASPSQINITNGNLLVSRTAGGASGSGSTSSTMGFSSGKWYWEIYVNSVGGQPGGVAVGIVQPGFPINDWLGSSTASTGYWADGTLYGHATGHSVPILSYTDGDTIGVALDMDNKSLTFYKNNVSALGTITGLPGTTYLPAVNIFNNISASFTGNFGQRAFTYTAPSGFKALCTQNLPTPAVVQGDDYFNTVLYTGTGSAQSITGVGFQPDFLWVKPRNNANAHHLIDAVRGIKKHLFSNLTNTEETANAGTGFTSFDSNGFSLGTDTSTTGNTNLSTVTYAAWNWKANGAGSSNTAGSISSTVSASTTAGFSVVTYTGTGANATVGHGLGVAPSMIIIKRRDTTGTWRVGHSSLTSWAYRLNLNETADAAINAGTFNSTAPTSTVFSVGTDTSTNASTGTYVAYCFAPVAGYSAFGLYNGNTEGPFIYTGFRPRWIMHKRTNTGGVNQDWRIWDTARSPSNLSRIILLANTSNADIDDAAVGIDILSNGFKIRNSDANVNATDAPYIYAAFAENPFKYSLAR